MTQTELTVAKRTVVDLVNKHFDKAAVDDWSKSAIEALKPLYKQAARRSMAIVLCNRNGGEHMWHEEQIYHPSELRSMQQYGEYLFAPSAFKLRSQTTIGMKILADMHLAHDEERYKEYERLENLHSYWMKRFRNWESEEYERPRDIELRDLTVTSRIVNRARWAYHVAFKDDPNASHVPLSMDALMIWVSRAIEAFNSLDIFNEMDEPTSSTIHIHTVDALATKLNSKPRRKLIEFFQSFPDYLAVD